MKNQLAEKVKWNRPTAAAISHTVDVFHIVVFATPHCFPRKVKFYPPKGWISLKKARFRVLFSWQGKKASNPRPTVLETAALPAELFPYKIGGPSGTRTPDRPVMSRLL